MEHFWYYRPEANFPPPVIRRPEPSHSAAERLCVSCTQTELSSREQSKLVAAWCDLLPEFHKLRYLWLSSRVPQRLFDAACQVPNLEGLWVKWSGIKTVDSLSGHPTLRSLHLGSSASVVSIAPLSELVSLRWLGLENIKRVSDIEPIGALAELEGLTIEGSMYSTQRVRSLAPLSHLKGLRYLSLANLRAEDASLAPLYALTRLEVLTIAQWWDPAEVDEVHRRNPGLAV